MEVSAKVFKAPHGLVGVCKYVITSDAKNAYEDMTEKGFNFTVEILRNGVVSICIEDEDMDVDMKLIPYVENEDTEDRNDRISDAMVKLLLRRNW